MNGVYIIAEIGVNHNGSLQVAKKLIDAAAIAGVDAVKFQTFKAESLVCKNTEKAEYQKKSDNSGDSQFEMLKVLEMTSQMHEELLQYSEGKGIQFLSSPFDIESINYLDDLGIPIIKVPSGEITDFPYLKRVGELKKKVIMSTGMARLEEIEAAVNVLHDSGSGEIILLHCNSEYPTPYEDVNLKAMLSLRDRFGLKVGYSDHTMGIEIPIAAVAMGAAVIEKHFTLDRKMLGPDHKASLEPDELVRMVKAIRNVERAIGSGIKNPTHSEQKNITVVRKSIVAKKKIEKGEIFTEENLTTKRPGKGISPMKWNEVVGKTADRVYEIDEMIKL